MTTINCPTVLGYDDKTDRSRPCVMTIKLTVTRPMLMTKNWHRNLRLRRGNVVRREQANGNGWRNKCP
jgi:hypothetical protein